MKLIRKIGNAAVAYIDDGQGQRVIVGAVGYGGVIDNPTVLARTKAELRAAVALLKDHIDDLPERA